MKPEYVKTLPTFSGIYVFKDKNGGIIYIGKAKNLRQRVSSYFNRQTEDWKVQELVKEHASIEHILTKNELEALLLEAQLIKTYKPKYNVLLKSGNPFIYITITEEELPQLKVARTKKSKGTFFGPFLQKNKARSVHEFLLRTLRLRVCSVRIGQGCLEYHMNRCAGNCLDSFNKEEYLTRLTIARCLLEGNHEACEAFLKKEIQKHNHAMEFEISKNLSRYLGSLEAIFATLKTKFTETKYAKDISALTTHIAYKADRSIEALGELQELLALDHPIISIDCFDISHFQSSSLVGSAIRFTHGIPDKHKFRRFKITSLIEQNDYAALQEIVQRRYRNPADLPDIMLIDGGKGQLSAVRDLFPHVPCLSLAKKEELLYTPLHPEGIQLSPHTAFGQLLIQIRDYAHHFAISYHKTLRSKRFTEPFL
ncbi:GIY-YIG nuclease family protein [Candidatus Dependentiae bacterium]|nr:GIY-YIG nuclease family protein [Candidatus Dependentiae bacterium]